MLYFGIGASIFPFLPFADLPRDLVYDSRDFLEEPLVYPSALQSLPEPLARVVLI